MNSSSDLKYIFTIVAFCAGVIGMFAIFILIGPLAGVLFFWAALAIGGYVLYRLLTEDS